MLFVIYYELLEAILANYVVSFFSNSLSSLTVVIESNHKRLFKTTVMSGHLKLKPYYQWLI